MFRQIKELFSTAKKPAKRQPKVLQYEELEQRVLFSADFVPGLDNIAVDEQVLVQDVTNEFPVEREAAPETVEQTAAEARWELAFVSEDVADYGQLIADLQGGDNSRIIEVVVLEADRDGIEQVSEILSNRSGLAAVHFITHGADGQINLGNSRLNSTTLAENSDAVAGWGKALTETGDILFYGCNVAADGEGQSLLDNIGELTRADVIASDDLTGNAALGGDWELEYTAGKVETSVAISHAAQQTWSGVLSTYTVSSTVDSGAGSLRQAIIDANANANSGGPDLITFDIGADGSQQTINLLSALDPISESVIIDGFSQYGALTPTVPVIEINGAGAINDGLSFASTSDGSIVQGVMITGFSQFGIQVDSGVDGITILGNWIGTTGTGYIGVGNYTGINVQGVNTIIGGTGANDGNVITNNSNEGINITGSGATGTIIKGNIIGLDPDGDTGTGNGDVGIALLSGADNTTIGGITEEARNIISNNYEGIEINSNNNTVQGNYIGTDITGTFNRGNDSDDGIEIQNSATGNLIGGTAEGAGNLIAFNFLDGVNIVSGSGNAVLGNDIHSNGDQDIDLGAGANSSQTAPALSTAAAAENQILITGSLSSAINDFYRIEFFADTGGIQTYIGYANVATDGTGNATIDATLNASVAVGASISATATNSDASYTTFSDSSELGASTVAVAANDAPTFSVGDGIVTTAIGLGDDDGRSVTVQSDGKILVAGRSFNGSDFDFALVRYDADGTLDTSFSSDGMLTTAIGAGEDVSPSVAVQPDGKILMAGRSFNGTYFDFALVRYNADGTLDTSFSGDGMLTTAVGSGDDISSSVTVQADGKILVAGRSHNGSDLDFALVRYNADGTPDTSFDSDGIVTTDFGPGDDRAFSVVVQPDGKILVAGDSDNGSNIDFALARYNADGSLDTSFDGNGRLITDFGSSVDRGYSVVLQADGKIVVAGRTGNGLIDDFALARYNADGTLDTSFDGDGLLATAVSAGLDYGRSVTLQPDGKILVAGQSYNGSNNDFAVLRLNANGTLDTSFGGDGMFTAGIGSGDDIAFSITVQPDGKILAAGQSHNGSNNDFAVLRLNADGTLDTAFDVGNPVKTLDGAPTFVEDGPAVVLDADVDVSDAELDALNGGLGNYAGASLTLVRNGGAVTEDVFAFNDGNGITLSGGNLIKNAQIIASFDTVTTPGELVVSFTDANGEIPVSADVDNILRQITYANSSDSPPASAQIDWTFDDGNTGDQGTGGALQATGSTTVSITAVNDAPTFIDGSVGNWNFDEGSGDSIVESAIGISTGTLGSTAGADANDPTWTTGKFGQALHFDGVNDYVEIADAPGIDISGPQFSASLWMKPDSGPNKEDMLFMKGDREGNVNYYLSWKNTGVMTWAFKDGDGWHYKDMPVTLPTTDQWNHVAITFDKPTISLYVNGNKYVFNDETGGDMNRDLTANDEVLWIGAGRSGGALVEVNEYSGPFSGSIDELALFDRALTDAEIEAIRTSTPPAVTASAFSIDENSANNTVVGTVVANDQDIGDTLSYAITAGNTGGAFSIDANGQIKVANSAALDFETNPTFNLTIEATDDGSPNLSDTMAVTITLANVDDAPAQVNNTGSTVTEGGTDTITNTELRYDDSEQSASSVIYTVTSGLANGRLELTTDPGMAITFFTQDDIDNNRLVYVHDDSETSNDSFNFTVDDGQGNSVTGQYFSITVTPVNDAAPVATDDTYSVDEDNTLTAEWWNTAWTCRQELTFDNTAQAETLTDFPVLVILNSSNIDYAQTKDDSSDLRFFAADGTPLAYEIEQWNEGGDSSVWVRVPQITGNSDSGSIWMYYGNDAAESGEAAGGVWDSNFVGVWHLNEEQIGTGTSGVYKDSTSIGNNGIDRVAATGQEGQVTDGQKFGANDWIEIDHDPSLNLKDSMTISFWIKPTSDSGTFNRVVEKGLWGYQDSYYFGGGNGTNDLTFYLNDQEVFDTSDNVLTVGEWQHCTVSYTSNGDGTGSARLYINGVEVDINGDPAGVAAPPIGTYNSGIVTGNTGRLAIGHSDSLYDFDGFIDEVQISNTDRSADWIAAQYLATKNQFGGEFVQFGGEESAPAVGGVLSNDTDVDGDPLTVTLIDGPDNAQSFTLNKDGTFTYTPTTNYHGSDTFTYEVSDGNGGTAQATATITVNLINDAPAGANNTVSTAEDTDYVFAAANFGFTDPNDSPADNFANVIITTTVANGTLYVDANGNGLVDGGEALSDLDTVSVADITAGRLKFKPAANENGTGYDSFTFQVVDDGAGADTDLTANTMTVDVNAVNDAPIARPDGVHLSFDGDDFIQVADAPSLQMTSNVTIEAWINHDGTDTGSKIIVNKEGEYEVGITAETGEIKFAFANQGTPDNWAWHNTGYFVTAGEWTHVAVTYDGVAGEAKTYINGELVDTFAQSGDLGDVYPTFNELWIGGRQNDPADRFKGQIDEVRVWSSTRTQGEIQASMGGQLTGGESGLAGNWRLDEAFGSVAIDQSASGNDGVLGGSEGAAATPTYQGYSISEDSLLTVPAGTGLLANDFDADGDILTVTNVDTTGMLGNLVVNAADGSFTYDPRGVLDSLGAGERLRETFTYTANDGSVDSSPVTVTIMVVGVNDAPVNAVPGAQSVNEDTALAIGGISVSDVDGNLASTQIAVTNGTLNVTLNGTTISAGANGSNTLTISGSQADINATLASLTYQGNANFNGSDTLTVISTDSAGTPLSDTDTVDITVDPVADLSAQNDAFNTDEDTLLNGNVATNDTTTSGGTLTYAVDTDVTSGSLSFNNDGTFSYTPDTNFVGNDSFTYIVTDADSGESSTQTATITVNTINDPPVNTVPGAQSVNEDTTLAIGGISVSDVDGNLASTQIAVTNGTLNVTLSGTTISAGANGSNTLTISGSQADINATLASLTYQGNANFNGSDTLTVISTDSAGTPLSDTDTVTVNVTAVNDTPTTTGIADVTVDEDAADSVVDLFAAFADVEDLDAALTYSVVGNTNPGLFTATTIDGVAGSLTLYYAADQNGAANITVRATDSGWQFVETTFTVTVNPVNDAPVIGGTMTGTVVEDGTLNANGTLTISDVDVSDNPISFPDEAIILGDNGYGDFVLTGGTWTYTLNNSHAAVQALDVGESLTDTHIFTASDGSTQLVTMTINGAENAPIALDDAVSGNEDTVITGNVLTNDTDTEADPLTANLVSGPAHGSLTLSADGSFSYTPDADWNGTDSFTYTANDGALDSNVTTMTITVNPVNDAPGVSSSAVTAATENAAYSYTVTANDIDGDDLTITASTLPAWLTLVDNGDGTATLSGTPTNADVGEHSVELDISDGELLYLQDFTLTVSGETIDPPVDDPDPDLRGSTTPDPELFENPETDDEQDPDTEAPTQEDQPQDPVIEAEQAAPVVEDLTTQDSAHADDQLVHMQDPQINEEILYLTDDDDMDSQSEERDDDPSIVYYDNDLYKDLSLSKYVNINYTAADGSNLKSEDDLDILYLDSDDQIPVDVNGDYDLHRQQIDESFDIELKSQETKAKIVSVTAASFAAGFVSYLLRAGSLVANLMSTLPLWRGFDPIVIFSGNKKKKKKDRNDIPDTNEAKSETIFDDEVE